MVHFRRQNRFEGPSNVCQISQVYVRVRRRIYQQAFSRVQSI
jgi:hypothetical protein